MLLPGHACLPTVPPADQQSPPQIDRMRRSDRRERRTATARSRPLPVMTWMHDAANPTWRVLECLAAALKVSAELRLVPDEDAVATAAKLVEHLSPLQRLLKQPVRTVDALLLLSGYRVPFVVTGAVAALLQGFPTPFQDMRVLVRDDDAALEAL